MPSEAILSRIDPEVFQQTLDKKLADLSPLPAVVTRIMATINDPETCADDLNRLIALDQGLSSKMLRIVNSAYYGFPKQIGTITQAVVILGFNTVRNLVLGVSAFGILSRKRAGGLDRARFWEHSVATAVASGMLAKTQAPRNRTIIELAFLSGLLHDIGQLFLDCYFPEQYETAVAHATENSMHLIEAEREILGIDHVTIGRRIGEVWNFPVPLVIGLGGWDDPSSVDPDFFDVAAAIHAADCLAWQAGFGVDGSAAPEICPAVQEWLRFSDSDFADFIDELQNQFGAARDMLALDKAA